jgi:hypothetical protein
MACPSLGFQPRIPSSSRGGCANNIKVSAGFRLGVSLAGVHVVCMISSRRMPSAVHHSSSALTVRAQCVGEVCTTILRIDDRRMAADQPRAGTGAAGPPGECFFFYKLYCSVSAVPAMIAPQFLFLGPSRHAALTIDRLHTLTRIAVQSALGPPPASQERTRSRRGSPQGTSLYCMNRPICRT